MKEIELKQKDKLEITKQQVLEIQKVFEKRFLPKKNHTLFEINLTDLNIDTASFDELPALKWSDAVKGNISGEKKITKKENCIYISSLNKKNVIKILKRDYGITLKNE